MRPKRIEIMMKGETKCLTIADHDTGAEKDSIYKCGDSKINYPHRQVSE
jgi:hypothetical protein